MYVVTFYSFKGGVGRTMALINTAIELALRGKKVLVVDFDLEAPGIQTYEPFSRSPQSVGIVDYVSTYAEASRAPDVREYIIERSIDGQPIWLMPAGRQDINYARKLNSIDWLSLYEQKDGYLMFEDMKQQWRASFGFDYVLIDSRTGHTDVGGICTRQLPDANALMFFPNEQNIAGLKEVVRSIRDEVASSGKKISLHFCPSNVPDLDDEDLILQRHFDQAMSVLDYREPASIIRHYNSLSLLDQKIFVKDRKKTRLADEYRRLVDTIVSENIEDRSGALSHLDKIRASIRSSRAVAGSADTEKNLAEIFQMHSNDGEVAWSLAAAYSGLGNLKGEVESLNIAIKNHFSEAKARSRRASLLSATQRDLVQEDLKFVIASSESTVPEIISAITRLREIDSGWIVSVAESARIRSLSGSDLDRVVRNLIVDNEGSLLAAQLLLDDYERAGRKAEQIPELLLVLVASGNFVKAMEIIDRESVLASDEIEVVFNFACAEWGHFGEPPADLFLRTLELGRLAGRRLTADANFMQCLSLSSYVCGLYEDSLFQLARARSQLEISPLSEIFSCWKFFYVNKSEFASDLESMSLQMETHDRIIPEFLQRRSLWSEGRLN